MKAFADTDELMRFAKRFIQERLDSLDGDVRHCVEEGTAPFPALLYCFATIDLLGALLNGNATKRADTSKQSMEFMRRFMHYSSLESKLLIRHIRHKIVHLAQPKAVVKEKEGGKLVAWKLWHSNASRHLRLEQVATEIRPTSKIKVKLDHCLELSLVELMKDITRATVDPNGYLDALENNEELKENFDTAIATIYDPEE